MSQNAVGRIGSAYIEAAKQLRDNPGQWQVYESRANCIVLAGPGSGKTKTLTIKMARMLAEDIRPPRGVACITYNTECARELKERLDRLGVQERRNIFIGTVHSFCLKHVVLPFGTLAGLKLPENLRVATPNEQVAIFERTLAKEISADAPPNEWKLRFDRYRRTHLDRSAPEWHTSDEDTANLIEKYEADLFAKSLIDFDGMVLHGLAVIEKHEWVRRALRARFPILVVDEYQDLGVPLHRIVLSLCFRGDLRLLAVGDPDQSIYGFIGAKPELLRQLAQTSGVESVPLRFNYRSGRTLVKAAEAALGERRDYEAKGNREGTIDFYECPDGLEEEVELICTSIIPQALERAPERKLGDIAVLYTDRAVGNVIATKAAGLGMKFVRIDKGAPYSKTPLTRWLEDCAVWCSGGWKQGQPRLSTVVSNWLNFNRSVNAEKDVRVLKLALIRFLFSHRSATQSLHAWLLEFDRTCLRSNLEREVTMRDELETFNELLLVCAPQGVLESFSVAAFAGQSGASDHLNLITLHSSKGLEFDVVVMMGMDQGRLPAWSAASEQARSEARRLFFVGLTRARHEVHMTYSGWTANRYGRRFERGPSEFLIEVRRKLQD
jgi:DNA helicase-2/ATP-dependent DNA helicase PcrA